MNPKWLLKKFLKLNDSVYKRKDMEIECKRANVIAVMEVAYIRALRKSGMDDAHIARFITDRYVSALRALTPLT